MHRLFVDAYGAQHPGDQADRRARKSVYIHTKALFSFFYHKKTCREALEEIRQMTRKTTNYPSMPLLNEPKWLTVSCLEGIENPSMHNAQVKEWAFSVFKAYKEGLDKEFLTHFI
jgi:hypothetical protein